MRAGLAADARRASARSIAELKNNPPPLPVDEIAEAIQFLEWLLANNFTFLGVREYALDRPSAATSRFRQRRSASCARREVRVLRRGDELLESRRRSWRS